MRPANRVEKAAAGSEESAEAVPHHRRPQCGQDSIVHKDGASRGDPIKLRARTASVRDRRGKEELCCHLSLGPGGDASPAARKSSGASPCLLADKAARTGVVQALAASM